MTTLKNTFYFLTALFLFSCSSDSKKELEKNIHKSLEIYAEANIENEESMKGAKLDSIVITKIDTVTPLYKTRIYQHKIVNEMNQTYKVYQATKDLLDKKIKLNKSRNEMFKSLSSEERSSVQMDTSDDEKQVAELINKLASYQTSLDSCRKIIADPKTDNKTLIGYYALFRLKMTKSDMTQTSIENGGIELTKDFRIIENKLEK